MTLATMLQALDGRVTVLERQGDLDVLVTAITDDSRKASSQSLFVAVKGEYVDGHRFIPAALKGGVSALVVQESVRGISLPFVRVEDSKRALGLLGSRFHGDPSSRIRMIGITGTNGKTTTAYVCKALLEELGQQVGLIGTVAYQIGTRTIPAAHTTPGALELQQLLADMAGSGCATAVMEVSSHALAQDRTSGCEYDIGVFSNLTQDHLDFHKTMENYFQAKLRLFTGLGEGHKKHKRAILNVDDPYGSQIVVRSPVPVWTYGLKNKADLRAENVQLSIHRTTFMAATPVGTFPIESHLVGEHNVYNLLAAIGVALHEGATPDQIHQAVRKVLNVPGRFERVMAGQSFTVVVDYAHTEDALVRLLTTAEVLKPRRIITMFGCGGDRDRGKRPKMGAAAVRYSDVVILTSDNPRTEDPQAILDQVEVGVIEGLRQRPHVQYRKIADRRQAIEEAVREAHGQDMVLIAGKGHEDYQIVGTEKLHFDDREVARDAIQRLGVRM
ncbi:MAG: UDP-N-acetylmuramoyl-L-alanyl-D-glutamate--2,6-diaminopimelate ligase [Nitrospira sp.]|nr:UDP-N-acetylmuramoyl-L-alanyl-D-glutamate--2,6-diaminopimelate ligase [Nitrospira sp.]